MLKISVNKYYNLMASRKSFSEGNDIIMDEEVPLLTLDEKLFEKLRGKRDVRIG